MIVKYKKVIIVFLPLLLITAAMIYLLSGIDHNPCEYLSKEVDTAMFRSIKRIDKNGALYSIDYTQKIDLDALLDADITNAYDLIIYANNRTLTNIESLLLNLQPGCSTFTSGSGDNFVFCRNFDSIAENSASLLVHTAPENGYESVGFSDIGGLGFKKGTLDDGKTDLSFLVLAPLLMTDGINEKGLAVSAMVLDEDPACQDRGKKKIMTTIAIRMLLDRAASTDEAIRLLDEYDMQSPNAPKDFHFMIADSTGTTKVIEYVNNEMTVLDERCATNFYLADKLHGRGHGQERYEKMLAALEEKNYELDSNASMRLLGEVSQHGNEAAGSFTLWSVIYDIKDKSLNIAVERNYNNVFKYVLGTGR